MTTQVKLQVAFCLLFLIVGTTFLQMFFRHEFIASSPLIGAVGFISWAVSVLMAVSACLSVRS